MTTLHIRARLYVLCFGVGCTGVLIGLAISLGVSQLTRRDRSELSVAELQSDDPPGARAFTSDAAMVLNVVESKSAPAFEAQMRILRQTLETQNARRPGASAPTWRVFKSTDETKDGLVLYVFWINPVLKGSQDMLPTALAEVPPDLLNHYASVRDCPQRTLLNLTRVSALGR